MNWCYNAGYFHSIPELWDGNSHSLILLDQKENIIKLQYFHYTEGFFLELWEDVHKTQEAMKTYKAKETHTSYESLKAPP